MLICFDIVNEGYIMNKDMKIIGDLKRANLLADRLSVLVRRVFSSVKAEKKAA